VYLSKLKEQINLEKITQAIDNSEIIDDYTLIKFLFYRRYILEKTNENINGRLDIVVNYLKLIKDIQKNKIFNFLDF
jgi:hypothetical protein